MAKKENKVKDKTGSQEFTLYGDLDGMTVKEIKAWLSQFPSDARLDVREDPFARDYFVFLEPERTKEKILYLGLGSVYLNKKKNVVVVEYSGNMGSRIEDQIIPRFEERFGIGTYALLQANAIKEEGYPSDWYELHIDPVKFEQIVGKKISC